MKKRNELSALSGEELISISGGYAPQADEAKGPFHEFLDILKWR